MSTTILGPIAENFNEPHGEFKFYDTLDNLKNEVLEGQEHIDIRGFIPSGLFINPGSTMYYLDRKDMKGLNELDMKEIDELVAEGKAPKSDNWSNGTISKSPSGVLGLKVPDINSETIIHSTMAPIDLSGMPSESEIVISLTTTSGTLNTASSLSLYNEAGDSQTFVFSESKKGTVSEGNNDISFDYSKLKIIDPAKVEFIFYPETQGVNVYVTGLRVIGPKWTPLSLDINTQGQFLRPIVTQSGALPQTEFYTMYRASDPPSKVTDPSPINSQFGCIFYTASREHTNEITMYFRQRREAQLTQLDLNYVPTVSGEHIGYTQKELDKLGHQPDYGQSIYQPRSQIDLDEYDQEKLDQYKQYELERISETIDIAYIKATLKWRSTGEFEVGLSDYQNENGVYNFNFSGEGIKADTSYFFEVNLENNTASCSVCPVNDDGQILYGEKLLYTGEIDNPIFYRAAGRIGWSISLGDKDAFIKGFNPIDLVFAEYQSKTFRSRTPVAGASLLASYAQANNLYSGAESFEGGVIAINTAISNSSDGSIEITGSEGSGIITYPFDTINTKLVKIKFDIYVPSTTYAVEIPKFVILNGDGYFFETFVGKITPNIWQTIELTPVQLYGQPGNEIKFASIVMSKNPLTWYLDNLSIEEDVVTWEARSKEESPFGPAVPWLSFGQIINKEGSGITFHEIGSALQLRAKAHSQKAWIDRYYLLPSYAQLGAFSFNN